MTTTTITVALLEALLSADGSLRSQAEAALASLEVTQRIAGLLPHCHGGGNNTAIATLSAVLLRRDIVKLTQISPLEQLVEPLWELFVSNISHGHALSSRLAALMGHCLAQVCASLALLNEASCATVVSQLLQRLEVLLCRPQQGHVVEALQLVGHLAESAPLAILQSPVATTSLPTWYSPSWSPAALQAWNHALVQVAKATTLDSSSSSSTPTTTWGGLATTTTNLDALKVDPNSMAATILGPCLLPLLEWMSKSQHQQEQHQDVIIAILQDWQQATTVVPSLLAGTPRVLERLVGTCLQLSSSSGSSSTTDVALQALYVLTSLLAVGDVKRTCWTSEMVAAMYHQAMPRCVQILQETSHNNTTSTTEEEEDQEWLHEPATLHSDDGILDEEDGDYTFALELLGDFVGSLGGLSHVLPLAEQALQPGNHYQTKIGFSILRTILHVAPVSVQPHIPTMVQASLHHASHHHCHNSGARIHYQILELWGDLAHTKSLPTESLPSILESLATTISTTTTTTCGGSTKLPARACLTLTHVAQHHAEDLTPILKEGGLSQLLQVLIQGPLSLPHTTTPGALAVKVRAVGAIAGLAQACSSGGGDDDGTTTPSLFTPQYYADLMPGLVGLLMDPTTPHELQTASLEAFTLVGQAVGVDLFGADAHSLLQSWMLPQLPRRQQTNDDDDCSSSSSSTLLLASARFAAVLQEDFHPYMSAVFPVLMQAIQASPDISIMEGNEGGLASNNDDEDEDNGTTSMTVAVPGRGFTKVTINTTQIQEQAQAARALYEHAKALGALYAPYTAQSLEALLALVSFPYSSDVRSTCAQTLAAVLECAILADQRELVRTQLPQIAHHIAQQIPREDGTNDAEALYALADSLSEVYYLVHKQPAKIRLELVADFGYANAEHSVQQCLSTLQACLDRRVQLTRVLQGGNLTGEDEQQDYIDQLQVEEQLLTPLVDSIGYTLKFLKQSFLPLFEKYVVPALGPKLEDQSDPRATLSAVCLFDDVVEHCGPEAAAKYAPRLVPAVVSILQQPSNQENVELLQAAVYGVAQISRHAPNAIQAGPHLPPILHCLLALTGVSKEEAGDNVYLVEMAASALAALTLLGPYPQVKFVPQDTLVESFLRHLPILQDDDEAKICHMGLCHLVESGSIPLSNDSFSIQVARIIGDILVEVNGGEDGLVSPDTLERLSSILYQMQQSLAPVTLQQAFGGMSPDAQHLAASVLQEMGIGRKNIVTP